MIGSSRRAALVALPPLLALLSAGCQSPPSQLYLLSSIPPAPQTQAAAASGSSRPSAAGAHANGPVVGVSVTIPEYLDRTDIIERTSANELKPNYDAQWGENLAVTASRVVSDNLTTLLPSDDIMMLPSRSRRRFDYQVNLDLTRFESDPQGISTLAGRWSISDAEGVEKASGHVLRTEPANGAGYDAMAAAMSRNLAAVSSDIANALQRLPAQSVSSEAPPPSSTERARR
jgi:uncharacterized lipoprotein YmbA